MEMAPLYSKFPKQKLVQSHYSKIFMDLKKGNIALSNFSAQINLVIVEG